MSEAMNIIDYLGSEFDSFDERPLGDVDSLVLACLSYYRLPDEARAARTKRGVPLYKVFCAEWFDAMAAGLWDPKGLIQLLTAAVASPRLRGARLCSYVSETDDAEEKQFAACTLRFPSGDAYVSFRGTDNSLVGWKEDFNMAFETDVPSQRAAVAYLERVARGVTGKLYVGGHSKGGNLAVFAAARSTPDIQQRILEVYNNDGPGFTDYLMGDPGYLAMVPRIKTYVPQSSVIGMLLEHEEPYTIIKSNQVSVLQHDPYSWEVMGPSFVPMQSITADSQFVNQTIKAWIASMDTQERNRLVDALFGLLGTGGIDKALDIFHPRNIRTYIKTLGNDPETRQILSAEFQNLMEAAKRTRMQPGDAKTLPEGK